MELFRPRRPESALLATPPPRRMSTPAGDRLSTILENNTSTSLHNQPAHSRHDSHNNSANNSPPSGAGPFTPNGHASKWSVSSRSPTVARGQESTPPPYSRDWQAPGARINEKASRHSLRSRFSNRRRGGWGRILIILVALFIILAVALGVGLGVGLTRHHNSNNDSSSNSGSSQSGNGSSDQFPLGEYSFVTSLQEISTNCTSDAATWRCFPYQTFEGDNSTSGLTLFNWVLSSTSKTFASNSNLPTTNAQGIPANLSISSDSNPFTVVLTNQSLTFINNNSEPRYTFSFMYQQTIIPTAPLSGSNSAAECLYNHTSFTATLYLSGAPTKSYPGAALSGSSQVNGGYAQWPYAVEIVESVAGGQSVPSCYATNNGVMGAAVGSFTAQPSDQQCVCRYSNFD